jgi:hypothetical protein
MSNTLIILSGSTLYLIIFGLYLELGKGLGNVWYRIGADGARHIRISHLFSFILKPFSIKELWLPINWDINYFIGASLSCILIKNLTLLYLECK